MHVHHDGGFANYTKFNRPFIHRIPEGFDRNIKQRFQPLFYDIQSIEEIEFCGYRSTLLKRISDDRYGG